MRHVVQRGGDVAAARVDGIDADATQVALRVAHGGFAAFDAEHAHAIGGERGQRQREQTGSGVQVPHRGGGRAVEHAADQPQHVVRQGDRRLAVHLPEARGVHHVPELMPVDGHGLLELPGPLAQGAVDEDGVIVRHLRATGLGGGDADLRAGFETAIPDVMVGGDLQQGLAGQRHRVDRHTDVGAAAAHRRSSLIVDDHLDAGTPVEASGGEVALHAFDGHVLELDMPQPAHLFADGDGLPAQLALKAHMDQVGAAHAAAHRQRAGQRPGRGHTVFARLEDLDHLAGPIAIVTVVRLVEHDAHEFAGQRETDEHHASVKMADAPALIGISFDADRRFHASCS